MKIMIASDIHGSALYCEKMLQAFRQSGAERLVLLGDILYHGPRNDLPEGYAPKTVISLLNPLSASILAVRGNCDTEVDQMVLDFSIMADYALLSDGDIRIFATHGHHFSEEKPPQLQNGDILLCGHTHVAAYRKHPSFVYLNPGSVSIPKENTGHGYILWEDRTVRRLRFDGSCDFTVSF